MISQLKTVTSRLRALGYNEEAERLDDIATSGKNDHWDKQQVSDIVKRAQSPWGSGWRLLGKEFQRAFIAVELCRAIMTQSDTAFPELAPFKELIRKAWAGFDS